jgi:hypothetical protein
MAGTLRAPHYFATESPDRLSPQVKVGSEIRRRHLEHVALVVENERADFKPGQRGHADGEGRDQNQS